jgi:hypothetical protein
MFISENRGPATFDNYDYSSEALQEDSVVIDVFEATTTFYVSVWGKQTTTFILTAHRIEIEPTAVFEETEGVSSDAFSKNLFRLLELLFELVFDIIPLFTSLIEDLASLLQLFV